MDTKGLPDDEDELLDDDELDDDEPDEELEEELDEELDDELEEELEELNEPPGPPQDVTTSSKTSKNVKFRFII